MTIGLSLGLVAALGAVTAIYGMPPMRRLGLAERIAPYFDKTPLPSKLLEPHATTAAPFAVARKLLGPTLAEVASVLDRAVGGDSSVRRRLVGLRADTTIEDFRIEQITFGVIGMVVGGSSTLMATAVAGGVDPVVVAVITVMAGVGGLFARDMLLTKQLERRERAILAELPVVADLLSIAVVAGESATAALGRISKMTKGEAARDIASAVARAHTGVQLTVALTDLARCTTVAPFARFIGGLVTALERGTPLAGVLRAQSADSREAAKRTLLETGGKREIAMMLPVVFLILPVTVVFAMYPGLLTLTSLTH